MAKSRRGWLTGLALMGAMAGVKLPEKVQERKPGLRWTADNADPIGDIHKFVEDFRKQKGWT